MTVKKYFGIVLAVLFGGAFVIGEFTFLFCVMQSRGYTTLVSVLIGISPFVIVAILVGIIALILYLLEDGDEKRSKSNSGGKKSNAKR